MRFYYYNYTTLFGIMQVENELLLRNTRHNSAERKAFVSESYGY